MKVYLVWDILSLLILFQLIRQNPYLPASLCKSDILAFGFQGFGDSVDDDVASAVGRAGNDDLSFRGALVDVHQMTALGVQFAEL